MSQIKEQAQFKRGYKTEDEIIEKALSIIDQMDNPPNFTNTRIQTRRKSHKDNNYRNLGSSIGKSLNNHKDPPKTNRLKAIPKTFRKSTDGLVSAIVEPEELGFQTSLRNEKVIMNFSNKIDDEAEKQKVALEQISSIKPGKRGRRPTLKVKENLENTYSNLNNQKGKKATNTNAGNNSLPKLHNKKKSPVVNELNKMEVTLIKPQRIIKKKVIWDPDVPETQISFASRLQYTNQYTEPKEEIKVKKMEAISKEPKILNTTKRVHEVEDYTFDLKKTKLSEVVTNIKYSIENNKSKRNINQEQEKKLECKDNENYTYTQSKDDSMIVRCRSNSSYSSSSSRRLSVDEYNINQAKKSQNSLCQYQPNKPIKNSNTIHKESPIIINNLAKISNRRISTKSVQKNKSSELQKSTLVSSSEKNIYASFEWKTLDSDRIVHIILNSTKNQNLFTIQFINELTEYLEICRGNENCKAVCITSVTTNFCKGINYACVTQEGSIEKRKKAAKELAEAVTSFLQILLSFPKPIIAGISGNITGIGVMMLPLLDVIICSDKSVFDLPYTKTGQFPEGNCIFTMSNRLTHRIKTKLLLLNEKVIAPEAVNGGLVTKLVPTNKVINEALECAKKFASLSQKSIEAIKNQNYNLMLEKISKALTEEKIIYIEHLMNPAY